ncbi:MAG: hypothetical protein E7439_05935 [Ruminococcaceae bacterium]|nr:hypothetical protein [Oscillospiraceae bacterium]
MKRLICMLLLAALLILPGCQGNTPEFINPVTFYYPKNDVSYFASDSVISREIREAGELREDVPQLLSMYLQGPEGDTLKKPFPQAVFLRSFEITGSTANIVLSDTAARSSGLELTTACACLTATVCDLTGVSTVVIRAESKLLDGNKTITMNLSDILLLDDSLVAFDQN